MKNITGAAHLLVIEIYETCPLQHPGVKQTDKCRCR
jgi:hypothetical protein